MRKKPSCRQSVSGRFQYTDGGRSKYYTLKDVGDCVVRAIAVATDRDYKEVVEDTWKFSRKYGCPINWKDVYVPYLESIGWEKVSSPKFKGKKAKAKDLPKGRYIMRQANHLSALVDGVIHDIWDTSNKMVYCYYRKKEEQQGENYD